MHAALSIQTSRTWATSRVHQTSKLDTLWGNGGIVVIAPHPDDEILGCGALIAAMVAHNRPVWVMYMTDGGASTPDLDDTARAQLVEQRQNEAMAGLECLGVRPSAAIFVGAPDGFLARSGDHLRNAKSKLDDLLQQGTISSVLVTSSHDGHLDHKAACDFAVDAMSFWLEIRLFTYPVSSRIDADSPINTSVLFPIIVDTHFYLNQKMAALSCHASQLDVDSSKPGFTLSETLVEHMCSTPEYFSREVLSHDR